MAKLPNYYKVSVDGLTVKLDPIYEEMAEVVRCKDCKHFHKYSDTWDCRMYHGLNFQAKDDFCSCGERREGDA